MPQRNFYICKECKNEWETTQNEHPGKCLFCGSTKTHKSHHHKRAAKKSRTRERWSYKVR